LPAHSRAHRYAGIAQGYISSAQFTDAWLAELPTDLQQTERVPVHVESVIRDLGEVSDYICKSPFAKKTVDQIKQVINGIFSTKGLRFFERSVEPTSAQPHPIFKFALSSTVSASQRVVEWVGCLMTCEPVSRGCCELTVYTQRLICELQSSHLIPAAILFVVNESDQMCLSATYLGDGHPQSTWVELNPRHLP
jgi:hypothetical protein